MGYVGGAFTTMQPLHALAFIVTNGAYWDRVRAREAQRRAERRAQKASQRAGSA